MRPDQKRPNIDLSVHPIARRRYKLPTPIINEFHKRVTQWIKTRTPGGMIYGKPRLGKSVAIDFLMQILPDCFGNTPIINILCRYYKMPSEKTFFRDVLVGAGHSILTGDTASLRDRATEYLYERAIESSQGLIIMFFDEAQKLHEQQYRWLMDLYNELDRLGITLVVILVGQEELIHQYSSFQLAGKDQIIGRFMLHKFKFKGLTNLKDLSECLKSYDEDTDFPEGSGWSYTRYFFPSAYENGWRLANESAQLWQAFTQINDKYGIPGRFEIPMQYFCRTVENLLVEKGTDHEQVHISINMWEEAILPSGYINLARYRKDKVKKKRNG